MNLRILPLFLFSLALLPGCKEKKPQQASTPPTVEVISASETDLPVYREIVATLQGPVNTKIKPKIQGYLLTQEYEDGALVKKDDLLFTIDPSTYEIDVQQAKANVEVQEANLVKAELTVQRDQELIKADAISQKQLDNAVQERDAVKAQVAASKAALNQAKLNLSYCKIYAPIAGIVGKASTDIGDLVGPTQVLATMSNLDPIQAVFYIPERAYMSRAERLQELVKIPLSERPEDIELVMADGSIYKHKGRFQFINRQIDSGTGTIGVYVLFANPNSILRPGQYAMVRIKINTLKDIIKIPQRAIVETQGMSSVYTVNSDDTVASVPVKLGETSGSNVVVTSGLKTGDTVIVEGIQKVKKGAKVKTTLFKSSSSDSSDSSSSSSNSSASSSQSSTSSSGSDSSSGSSSSSDSSSSSADSSQGTQS
ncbi:efflux RND transporter periplasmic adaptor subunit [Puniceicoccus vermicola]|uniref:Efflux RND transporter periplasmic adaptor subunit n=1 Tax=Puniceicoccus vermicola TaxID=388746 RepID=A0A7X1AZ89_9BACT|nr:efflux RND transporter periplasmic adaptor subunit [Puniceicoccus vermicola]MBC2601678.1 efflux RND transporter periplasmic adaptor subunit [Puniceicoccus vermicola]